MITAIFRKVRSNRKNHNSELYSFHNNNVIISGTTVYNFVNKQTTQLPRFSHALYGNIAVSVETTYPPEGPPWKFDIYTIDLITKVETKITNESFEQIQDVAIWDSKIAFIGTKVDFTPLDVFIFDLNSNTLTNLTNGQFNIRNHGLDIQNDTVVFEAIGQGIFKADVNSNEIIQVTTETPAYNPSFYDDTFIFANNKSLLSFNFLNSSTSVITYGDLGNSFDIWGNYITYKKTADNGASDIFIYDLSSNIYTEIASSSNSNIPNPIPEPKSIILLFFGLSLLIFFKTKNFLKSGVD